LTFAFDGRTRVAAKRLDDLVEVYPAYGDQVGGGSPGLSSACVRFCDRAHETPPARAPAQALTRTGTRCSG